MDHYLTIPGEVEAEEILSYQIDQKTVVATIKLGDTANLLYRASAEGRGFELVVIMSSVTLALDNVYVSSWTTGSGPDDPLVTVAFDASEIRHIP